MAGGSSELGRAAGVLLPVFALPGGYGIGSFGESAYRFIDFLKSAGQRYWQILPLGPTSYGDSPYQSFSTFAGNPYFIDIDELQRVGLLGPDETKESRVPEGAPIDYAALYKKRFELLRTVYRRYLATDAPSAVAAMRGDYIVFAGENEHWLKDFALFMALKVKNGGKSFLEWPEALKLRDKAALDEAKRDLKDEIGFHEFLQFLFSAQLERLKSYAGEQGIRIIGDIPIYVAPDSSDVWANPELFKLNDGRVPEAVAGCPPDAFSATGQLWGNPLYNWREHERTGYAWWTARLKHAFECCDVLRIDHFRGFESYYSIPYGDSTAEHGRWEPGPGMALFEALKRTLGDMPVIAEDLGFLTPEVLKLVKDSGYPGMKVLQFAFDSREDSDYLPHNYGKNCVVYTGTHDNDTTLSWFESIKEEDRRFASDYLGLSDPSSSEAALAMIRAALSSVADTAIIPMQDWLGLGGDARINLPSTLGGNWTWRMEAGAADEALTEKIKKLTELYGRSKERT